MADRAIPLRPAVPDAPGAKGPARGELIDLPAATLRDRLASGAVRAVEVARAVALRTAEREPRIHGWAHFDADFLLAQATALDRYRGTGRALGPLHGLSVAIKDVIDTAEMPTSNGTALDGGRRPERDAALVSALKGAGAIVAGKSHTAEMAFLHPGPTRNPHDPTRTPGGSSSGSAALVAAGVVPLAVGTQTGGSVLRPASFCGVVGFKPTHGAIPTRGVLAQSPTLDTVGAFARDVEGAAMLAEALFGHDPDGNASPTPHPRLGDAARSEPPVPPVFALVRTPWWDRASADMRDGLNELAEALGDRCFAADLPAPFASATEVRETINYAEMAKCYAPYAARDEASLSDELRGAMERGRAILAHDYLAALDWRAVYRAGLAALFRRCDAIMMPAAPGVAPEGLASTGDSVFNALATLVGAPAISLPLLEADGPNGPLPMGVQLMGPPGDDARLVRTARWLERWAASTQEGSEA